jgi:archaellum component FlaC
MVLLNKRLKQPNKPKYLHSLSFLICFLIAFSVILGFTGIKSHALAAINETINIEGKIVNTDGTNATAACIATNICDFRLSIYDAQSGGGLLWQEVQNNIPVVGGIFSVKAGSVSALDIANLQQFNRNDLWVQIEFDPSGNADFAEGETFSRSHLAAVPYAMNSKYLNGLSSSQFLRSDTTTAYTSGILTFNAGTSLDIADIPQGSVVFAGASGKLTSDSTNLFWDNSNKRLGIGLADPDASLTVKDTINIRRTGTMSSLIFTNTSGTGDFRLGGDGNDLYWQGGGSRALQMGSYWTTILGGDTETITPPAFQAGATTPNIGVLVISSRTASMPLVVRGFAGQTADLTEWQNSAGTVLNYMNSLGQFGVGNPASLSAMFHVNVASAANTKGVQIDNLDTTNNTESLAINSTSTGVGIDLSYTAATTAATGLKIQNTSTGVITNAIDVSDPEIVNAIKLGVNNIVSDDNGTVSWNDSSGNELMRLTDTSTNFGAALDAGAFINRDSYMGEEFTKYVATATGDRVTTLGDALSWSFTGSNAAANRRAEILTGVLGGQLHIQNETATQTVNAFMGPTIAGPNQMFNATNLPVFITKVRPTNIGVNDDLWVGLQDNTQLTAQAQPNNGIFFTNYNGTAYGTVWYGVTRNGSASTYVNCTATINTGATQFALLKVEVRSITDVRFYIDADSSNGVAWTYCGQSTTNIPTATNLGTMLKWYSTTALRGLFTDYFRIWQDDAASAPVVDSVSNVPADVTTTQTPIDLSCLDPKSFNGNNDTSQCNMNVAELYNANDTFELGEIAVIADGNDSVVRKSDKTYETGILGVSTQNPGLVLGNKSQEVVQSNGTMPLVAVGGRALVKVSDENGPIVSGDFITSSSTSGVGMKAAKPGYVLGKALEGSSTPSGVIMVSVNPGFADPDNQLMLLPEKVDTLVAELKDAQNNGKSIEEINALMLQLTVALQDQSKTTNNVADNLGEVSSQINELTKTVNDLVVQQDQLLISTQSSSINAAQQQIDDLKTQLADLKDQIKQSALGGAAFDNLVQQLGSLDHIDLNSLDLKKDLAVQGKTIMNGSLLVNDSAVFSADLEIKGLIKVSPDTAGYVMVKKGDNTVDVNFNNSYSTRPVIVANVSQDPDLTTDQLKNLDQTVPDIKYFITNISNNGFTVMISEPAQSDVYFAWHALEVNSDK